MFSTDAYDANSPSQLQEAQEFRHCSYNTTTPAWGQPKFIEFDEKADVEPTSHKIRFPSNTMVMMWTIRKWLPQDQALEDADIMLELQVNTIICINIYIYTYIYTEQLAFDLFDKDISCRVICVCCSRVCLGTRCSDV